MVLPADALRAIECARSSVTLFEHPADGSESESPAARGLIEASGSDAPRWLDGMVSNDITEIAAGTERSGCYATLLTPKGRIIADLNILALEDCYWLEVAASAVSAVVDRLDRYIIADDVKLTDRSAEWARFGLEGPASSALLATATGTSASEWHALQDGSWRSVEIAGAPVRVARFGWSGEVAYQLFVPADSGEEVRSALVATDPGPAPGSFDALEVLRVEAGIPRLGAELDEEVFPDEARLGRAISRTKGCYTGQEIVARLYSRGAVNHLLVGLRFEGDVPAPDTELHFGDRRSGEVTSACVSPTQGAIGLGYVRREQAEPGTVLRAGSTDVVVADLPFTLPGAGS